MSIGSSIGSAIGSSIGRSIGSAIAGGGSTLTQQVQALFAGTVGVMFDMSDSSTLFQSDAGTTAVTTTNDPIGYVTDLSGNGKHATQAVAGNKPLWNSTGYAVFDGADDWLQTPAINFSTTDAVTIGASIRKLSDVAIGSIIELDNGATALNAFRIQAPSGPGSTNAVFASGGSIPLTAAAAIGASPLTSVLSGLGKISTDVCLLRRNGVQIATNTGDQGLGNYGNKPIYIGRRAGTSQPFNGWGFRYFCIGRTLSGAELNTVERWLGEPAGVLL